MFAAVALSLLAASSVLAQDLKVNTPAGLTQCQPSLITWSGGQAPYWVSVIPGSQPMADPLVDFGQTSDTKLTWTVNQPVGTSVTIKISDSTGVANYASALTVIKGSSDACLSDSGSNAAANGAADASAGATGASTEAASGASSAGAAAGTAKSSGAASSGGASKETSSTTGAAKTTSTSGAGRIAISSGVLAVAGAVALALF